MTRPRITALLLLVLLAAGAQARARPHPAVLPGQQADEVPEVVRQKREIVLDPQSNPLDISSAATTLLEHKDYATLRKALAGDASGPMAGVLAALRQAEPDRAEPLLEDVVALAARANAPELRAAADAALDNLVSGAAAGEAATPRQRRLLGWLGDPVLEPARRVVVLRALGRSRNLAYAEPLVEAVADGNAAEARKALTDLTGHDLGPQAGADAWRAWWAENRRYSRDELLDRALGKERAQREADAQQHAVRQAESDRKLVAKIIDLMGHDVPALVAGLSNEYAEVRLEAARRLAGKANDKGAAAALPALLRRLGANGEGNGNGHASPEPDAAATGAEADPRVRAAVVSALGVLGRSSDAARAALIAELRHPAPAVSAAAAHALESFRGQRDLVKPLLDYLVALPAGDGPEAVEARVKALVAIASNSPSGVIDKLLDFIAPSQPPAVRAAAVRALIQCEEIDVALGSIVEICMQDPLPDVRFAIAAALGDRLAAGDPVTDAALRTSMITQLGKLLHDLEATVRLEAAAALGRSGSASALRLLERRAQVESDPAVLKGLVAAVGALREPDGVRVVGELLAARREGRAALVDDAHRAIASIAGERAPQPWLDAAAVLGNAGAHDLAAYACREVGSRFGAPEHRDAADRAGGQLAVELLLDGQADLARTQLEQLEAADAPYPSRAERQLHLAEACRRLGDWSARADWLLQHIESLAPADARRGPETLAAATALSQSARHAEALPLLRDYVAVAPADNQALFDLALVEEQVGELEAALRDLDTLSARLPDGDVLREPVQAARARLKERTAVAAPPVTDEPRQQTATSDSSPPPDSGG